jgi:anti-sigma regulatory factor (Ser/Thr protein kinase)
MEHVLKTTWLNDVVDPIVTIDDASVALARERVREQAGALGAERAAAMVNVASELGHNQLAHARHGVIGLRPVLRDGNPGIEIIAADEGPGIADPTRALEGKARERGSLGVGLAAVLELADEVDVDTRLGEGTCIRARKFRDALPKKSIAAIYGRPCPGEAISGDDALILRGDNHLTVAIADGLGHGPAARTASSSAMDVVRSAANLDDILPECHRALAQTRGAVMAVARITHRAEIACVGNIGIHIHGGARPRRCVGPSFVLGTPGAMRRPLVVTETLGRSHLMVMFTDGISTRADIEGDHDLLLRAHPVVVAHQMVARFARDNDDALVLVIR